MTRKSRVFHVSPELVLDSRRAAWFPQARVLAVADLHLGYAWAHRAGGQLMPIPPENDTVARLVELQRDYAPAEIVVVGDIVHRAVKVPALEKELREVIDAVSASSRLVLLTGNHDRDLERVMKQPLPVELGRSKAFGRYVFAHGDKSVADGPDDGCIVMGHEHPAISIGDGVTTSQKCPCFLLSEAVVVLPAFSRWAAGTNIRAYPLMSEVARAARFTRAVAICGERLLPLPL